MTTLGDSKEERDKTALEVNHGANLETPSIQVPTADKLQLGPDDLEKDKLTTTTTDTMKTPKDPGQIITQDGLRQAQQAERELLKNVIYINNNNDTEKKDTLANVTSHGDANEGTPGLALDGKECLVAPAVVPTTSAILPAHTLLRHVNPPATAANVGAFAVSGMAMSTDLEMEADSGSEESVNDVDAENAHVTGTEDLFNATLVDDSSIVEAQEAPEGFQALIQNKKFKLLVAAMLLAFLAVIIPVAVVVPRNNQDQPAEVINNTIVQRYECGTALTNQADYRGTINTTDAGFTCQYWASQFPHSHPWHPEDYPAAGLDENYCKHANPNTHIAAP